MNQTVIIRKETPEDYDRVIELTEKAFERMPFSRIRVEKSKSLISDAIAPNQFKVICNEIPQINV